MAGYLKCILQCFLYYRNSPVLDTILTPSLLEFLVCNSIHFVFFFFQFHSNELSCILEVSEEGEK